MRMNMMCIAEGPTITTLTLAPASSVILFTSAFPILRHKPRAPGQPSAQAGWKLKKEIPNQAFMKIHIKLLLILSALLAGIQLADAQTFSTLYSFTGGNDGGQPQAGLIQG